MNSFFFISECSLNSIFDFSPFHFFSESKIIINFASKPTQNNGK